MKEVVFNAVNIMSSLEMNATIRFLHTHLEEYGDSKNAIRNAVEYAVNPLKTMGGFVLNLQEGDKIIGSVVMNQTGMKEYIPENVLVYLAVHKDYRGKGYGKKLMDSALKLSKGDIAIHVQKGNPAMKLYEEFGFTNPYLEMRLIRNEE